MLREHRKSKASIAMCLGISLIASPLPAEEK
jgi:hypothetical protein